MSTALIERESSPLLLGNYVREGLRLSFPPGLAKRDRLVLVLHGYFDDSGTHANSEAVTVAGYISTAEQWELFTDEWNLAIKEWGLEFFHMTDYVARAAPYDNWSDQERRFRFARLTNIIHRHVLASIGTVIPKPSFDSIFTKRAKRFIGGAYGLAATSCFAAAAEKLDPLYPSARIAYVFEAGTKGQWRDSQNLRLELHGPDTTS